MVYDDLSSEDLMPLVASGDKRAFSCLMNRHRKTVYGVVYRFFKTSQEAEDVFQDVFFSVWRSAERYKPTAKFNTWLYTVTANHCKNELASFWRRKVRLIGSLWEDATEERIRSTSPSTEEAVETNQQIECVRSAICALPAKQRMALILSQFEGLPYKEIAKVMCCSIPAVESLLFRAKNNLKKNLTGN